MSISDRIEASRIDEVKEMLRQGPDTIQRWLERLN